MLLIILACWLHLSNRFYHSKLFPKLCLSQSKGTKPEKLLIKSPISLTKQGKRETLNDIGYRLVLIPFFGIAIPLVVNLVDHDQFSNWQVKLSYLYTIGVAFVVWQGNLYLYYTLRGYFDWYKKPFRKALALIATVPLFTLPVCVLLLAGWYQLFTDGQVNWNKVWTATGIILISVYFIVYTYETVFLIRDTAREMINNEQLQRSKAEAELQALKSQIDPHFMFNSLNTLSHLIASDAVKAKSFNDSLAEVYRYILFNKDRNLVMLADELAFAKDYFELLHLRFGKAVKMINEIPAEWEQAYLVLPISLQLLFENAMKHNECSIHKPLSIHLFVQEGFVVVENNKMPKKQQKESLQIGLQNLRNRCAMATGREIELVDGENSFTVRVPVLKME